MSRGLKKIWKSADVWRSVAYNYFQESGQWRYLLDLNPSFDIRYHPAPGVQVQISGNLGEGKNQPTVAANPGTLVQVDTNLDLRRSANITTTSEAPGYYPWSSAGEYTERLGDYTAQALLNQDRANGFSLDSPQASADTQR